MGRRLMVLGIDPGTTLGFALLDLDGKLLLLKSMKNYSLSSIISDTVALGKIAVVGSDKAKVPFLVAKTASSLMARLVLPDHDLTLEEKKELLHEFLKSKPEEQMMPRNAHEKDALVCAIFALRQIGPRLSKFDVLIEKFSKGQILERAKENLIKHNDLSPDIALDMARKEFESKMVRENADKSNFHKDEITSLYSSISKHPSDMQEKQAMDQLRAKLVRFSKENNVLRQSNLRLRAEVEGLARSTQKHKNNQKIHENDDAYKALLNAERKKQHILKNRLLASKNAAASLYRETETLRSRIAEFRTFILDIPGRVLIKKLENLSYSVVLTKVQELGIISEEFLLVQDAAIVSQRSLDFLAGKVKYLICDRKNSLVQRYFPVIMKGNLKLIELDDFVLTQEEELQEQISKFDLLDRVVSEYRENRSI